MDFKTSPELRARLRGVMVVRNTRFGPKAQAWPAPRNKPLSPYERYKLTEFAWAAAWAKMPDELARQTAEALTKDTQYVWRDIVMAAMYGNYYGIFDEAGNIWERARMVAPNPQLVLDLVNDTPGSMLYRSAEGWVALLPPSMNSMLYWQDGAPLWGEAPSLGGGGPSILGNSLVNTTSAFGQAKDFIVGSLAFARSGDQISSIAFYATAAAATAKVTPCVYDDAGNVPTNLLASGPQVTGVVKGLNVLPLTTPLVFGADSSFYCCVQTAVATFNTCKAGTGTNFFKANVGAPPSSISGATLGAATGNITVWAYR